LPRFTHHVSRFTIQRLNRERIELPSYVSHIDWLDSRVNTIRQQNEHALLFRINPYAAAGETVVPERRAGKRRPR